MAPRSKKNASVIILDLKMDRDRAKKILKNLIINAKILQKKDETSLLLLNCATTTSPAHPNIRSACRNENFEPDMLEILDGCDTSDANWLHAVKLAADILREVPADAYTIARQIVFITDLKSEIIENDPGEIKGVAEELREKGIFFYVFGVDVKWSREVEKLEDLLENMRELQGNDVDLNSFGVFKEFVGKVKGVICREEEMLSVLRCYVNATSKQLWLQPLTFENFTFPTITSKILDSTVLPTIKPRSLYKTEKVYVFEPEEGDDTRTFLPEDSVTEANTFIDKVITLPDDVKEGFKTKGPKMFKLLGFINKSDFQEPYFLGGEAHRVTGDPTNPRYKLFLQLVKSAESSGKLGLALRAYYNNTNPRLYVLIPDYPNFIMVPHPVIVQETARVLPPIPKLPEADAEKVSAFGNYLNSLADKQFPFVPDCDVGVFYPRFVGNIWSLIAGDEVAVEGLEGKTEELVEVERVCGVGESAGDDEEMEGDEDDEDW